MESRAMSRRTILETGMCALVAAATVPQLASARAEIGRSPKSDETIRKWYAAWEQKDWHPVDILLADDFTFTSAAGDDHINKSAFKARCWERHRLILSSDLQLAASIWKAATRALVMYICRTKNGKTFRNVEYLRLREGQLEAIECYFGAQSSFPSAVSTGQS